MTSRRLKVEEVADDESDSSMPDLADGSSSEDDARKLALKRPRDGGTSAAAGPSIGITNRQAPIPNSTTQGPGQGRPLKPQLQAGAESDSSMPGLIEDEDDSEGWVTTDDESGDHSGKKGSARMGS